MVCVNTVSIQMVFNKPVQITSSLTNLLNSTSVSVWSVTGIDFHGSFPDSSSKEPTATADLLAVGTTHASELQSLLDRLGKYSTFLQTVLALGLAASEVSLIINVNNPLASFLSGKFNCQGGFCKCGPNPQGISGLPIPAFTVIDF